MPVVDFVKLVYETLHQRNFSPVRPAPISLKEQLSIK